MCLRSGEVGCLFLVCLWSSLSFVTFLHRGPLWDAITVGSFQELSDSRQLLFPAFIQDGVLTSRALGKTLPQPHSGEVPAAQSPSPGSPKKIITGIPGEDFNRNAQAAPHRWQWPFRFLLGEEVEVPAQCTERDRDIKNISSSTVTPLTIS